MNGKVDNATSNIDLLRKDLEEILNLKYIMYKQQVETYNHNVKMKYTAYKPFDEIPLYRITPKEEFESQTPSAPNRILRLDAGRLIPTQRTGSGYNVMDTIFQGRR
jgi:hypothetical protein